MTDDFSFDVKKIKIVPISEVRPNTWNPKQKDTKEYRKIVDSIKRDGVKSPVIVRENNGYEIIDGQQRYTALLELDAEDIVIYNNGVVSDTDAKNETLWWQLQVPFDDVMLAPLIAELQLLDISLPFELNQIQELIDIENLELGTLMKPDDSPLGMKTLKVLLNEDAYSVVMEAINKVKAIDKCNDAQAIERICADYLAGA